MPADKIILKPAIYSRIAVITLQYLGNILIPDHNAGVFLYPKSDVEDTVVDKVIEHFFGGFIRWDAHYFIHIAKYGYTYENSLAFFPLYPCTVRLISSIIYAITPFISFDSVIVLVALGVNIALFIFSAKVLFNLTTAIFNETLAYRAGLVFCFNPASIFFTAPYTECMFSYVTFQSILNCIFLYKKYASPGCAKQYSDILYLWPICLSTVVRSNGVLNIGFLMYTCFCLVLKHYPRSMIPLQIKYIVKCLFVMLMLLGITLFPFIVFQVYCYYQFCTNFEIQFPVHIVRHADNNGYILPGQFSVHNQSWCYNKLPLAYSYVQDQYWNVGFLKYYELKQIPNFLLALPILYILLNNCFRYVKYNGNMSIRGIFSCDELLKKQRYLNIDILHKRVLNVFVIHILFLTIFCILFIHIQVSTRMLCSSSPFFYWICANYSRLDVKYQNPKDFFDFKASNKYNILILYCATYFIIGTILFCNFLPWT